jgi:hypothetical protein
MIRRQSLAKPWEREKLIQERSVCGIKEIDETLLKED